MLEIEEYIMIRELHAKGFSITDISDKTGFDRKTVKKYLNITTILEPKQRAKKASMLDQYKDHIIQKLNQAPFTASRLYREIQEMGFKGKCTIVRDFVRKVRPETGVQAVYRFETKPGVQAQVDWSELGRVEIDGKNLKLYCFNMILGYSRMRYIEFTLSIDVYTQIFFWPFLGWKFPSGTPPDYWLDYFMIMINNSFTPGTSYVFISEVLGLGIIIIFIMLLIFKIKR